MEIGEESTILDMESTIVELFNLFLYKFGIGNRGFWLFNSVLFQNCQLIKFFKSVTILKYSNIIIFFKIQNNELYALYSK